MVINTSAMLLTLMNCESVMSSIVILAAWLMSRWLMVLTVTVTADVTLPGPCLESLTFTCMEYDPAANSSVSSKVPVSRSRLIPPTGSPSHMNSLSGRSQSSRSSTYTRPMSTGTGVPYTFPSCKQLNFLAIRRFVMYCVNLDKGIPRGYVSLRAFRSQLIWLLLSSTILSWIAQTIKQLVKERNLFGHDGSICAWSQNQL